MDKDNELLEKQLENDEDLLDFDLDDLSDLELDEESQEGGDIIELVDLVEEGEDAVEGLGEEIAVLREEEPAKSEGEQTHVMSDEERPLTKDLSHSDLPDEIGAELDMALSDLELTEESEISEDIVDLHEEQESIESVVIDEEEMDKDLEDLFSDDELSDAMIEGDLETPLEADLNFDDTLEVKEVAAAEEAVVLEETESEEEPPEETPLEDLEEVTGADLSFEEPLEQVTTDVDMSETGEFLSEEEKVWESDIEGIQEEKMPGGEPVLPEKPLIEEATQIGQAAPEMIAISEERIEAIVKSSVEGVMERVATETMSAVVEKVARETMNTVAEKVIGEAIEALKRSLDSSTD